MDFKSVINKRKTIRDFSSQDVPFDIIKSSIEAGMKAPTYNHLKQWDFILVKNLKIRLRLTQTEDMVEELSKDIEQSLAGYEGVAKAMYLEAIPKQKRMILSAPELLVVVYRPKTQIEECKRIYDLNCLASVWCCIENILLNFADNDIFGVTFIPKNTTEVKKILGIPNDLEIATLIPFGYKAHDAKILSEKDFDLESKIHFDNW